MASSLVMPTSRQTLSVNLYSAPGSRDDERNFACCNHYYMSNYGSYSGGCLHLRLHDDGWVSPNLSFLTTLPTDMEYPRKGLVLSLEALVLFLASYWNPDNQFEEMLGSKMMLERDSQFILK